MSGTAQQVDSGNVKSPTTLVLDYMRSKGVDPASSGFSQKLRTVLEESARNPGLIPGLINDRPSTDAEDQAAMLDKATGTRRAPLPQAQTTGPMDRRGTEGDPQTSAPPPGADSGSSDKILATLGVLAPSLASLILGRGGLPTPGGSVPPMPDVAAGVPQVRGPGDVPLLQAPAPQITGPEMSPMESAMQKAIVAPPPRIAGPADVTTPQAAPPDVIPLPDQSVAPVEKPRTRVKARSRLIAR